MITRRNAMVGARLAKGLTQRELGVLIHRSQAAISQWERGYPIPAGARLFLAIALELDEGEL